LGTWSITTGIRSKQRKNQFSKINLRRSSKFSQISPVFFVSKKDKSKKMVIDYYGLNEQTIKNNYLLPLITDLIDNIGSKKVFTKINLW